MCFEARNAGIIPETVLVIATIVLAGATIYLAYFNQKLWWAQDRPYLYFYKKDSVTPDLVDLYVVNVGKGVALDVVFKVARETPRKYPILIISKEEPAFKGFDKDTVPIRIWDIKFKDINGISYTQPDLIIQIAKTL